MIFSFVAAGFPSGDCAEPVAEAPAILREAAGFPSGAAEETDRVIASGWKNPGGKLVRLTRNSAPLLARARQADWKAYFSGQRPVASAPDPRDRVYRESRNLARLLLLEARRLQHEGKLPEAIQNALAVRRLSQSIGTRLNLVSYGTSLRLSTLLAPVARDLIPAASPEEARELSGVSSKRGPCAGRMSDYLRVEGGQTAEYIRKSLLEYKALNSRGEEFVRKAADKTAELAQHYFERLAEASDDPSSGETEKILNEVASWQAELDARFQGEGSAEELFADYAARPQLFDEDEITTWIARLFVSIAIPDVRSMAKIGAQCADAYAYARSSE